MELVLNSLNEIHPLEVDLREHLMKILKVKTIEKKAFLLRAGMVCNEICFIESGLLRSYMLEDGIETCKWFMLEGDIAIAIQSFLMQTISKENIQALEKTTVQFISYRDLQDAYIKFPEFNINGRKITERYYCLSEERLDCMRGRTAKFKYEYMVKNHPDIIRRVPLKYLASYLGIQKEYLSVVKGHLKRSIIHKSLLMNTL